jgi:outer membrane protein
MRPHFFAFLLSIAVISCTTAKGQTRTDSLSGNASLDHCIYFALEHRPVLQQSLIDEQITENAIKNRLADWYPQIGTGLSVQHYFQLPTVFTIDNNGAKKAVTSGVSNSSLVQVTATQNIFNRDLLLARKTAGEVREQTREQTTYNKIDVAVQVSKAYYDLLLTQKQVAVFDENIVRLKRSLQDAYNQYQGGIVDKIDYKRAQIALNNSRADRKRAAELVDAKLVLLKQLMGFPQDRPLSIVYDSLQMERDVNLDTLQQVSYADRIEYKQLQTMQSLLQANLKYYRTSYLPTVSAFGSYNPNFYNDRFSGLYGQVFPNSYIGLQLSLPIFQGGKRQYNIRTAELQIKRVQWGVNDLVSQINTQYAQALSNYKGNLAEWKALRDNMELAADVYNTLQLQYNAGIKTYLDVIIAETDLHAAQINYLNALYNVLSSKLDLQRALGSINY